MSYYLKYRPQQTKDLDIKVVRDFFAGVLTSGRYQHAYLFSGPRGTGKTSSARILAKLLNCENNAKNIDAQKPLSEPCGKCDMCKRIVKGNSLSVMEMDAASNRGIDDIRALRERIGLAPAEGKFVVYIIDEVHMLTTEAFNALLKTLEEPPAHAIFALCTTEYHKLPQTVVSRCTQVLYPKATAEEVIRSLGKVVKGEKLTISDESLQLLAESVDGSFRDGVKMLEQLTAGGDTIADESVQELVQRSSTYDVQPFIEALLARDVQTSLSVLDNLEKMGVDFAVYTKRILESLREMLLLEMKKPTGKHIELIELTDGIIKASMSIKDAFVVQLPLELLVAQWCLGVESKVVQNASVVTPSKPDLVQAKPQVAPQPKSIPKAKPTVVENRTVKPKGKNDKGSEVVGRKVDYSETDVSYDDLMGKWQEVLQAVKPHNHSLEALLRSSRPKAVEGSSVVIEVFYKFHKERLEQDKHRVIIEDVICEVLKSKIQLVFELGEKTVSPVEKAPAHTEADVKAPVSSGKDEELAAAAEEIFS